MTTTTAETTTELSTSRRSARARVRQAGVRDLHEMLLNAESSRVLNLSNTFEEWRGYEEYADYPLFENKALNRSIIIKQAVAPADTFNFRKGKGRATKILFPLDRYDYSLGGLYLFIGQKNFSGELARHFSGEYRLSERDDRVLQMLDELPTLDPFLLFALLRSNDLQVSEVYFQLSENDRWQIQREMATEFAPLVSLCFPSGGADSEKIGIFIDKILNFTEGEELSALRESFKLNRHDFAMTMFAWRGLIYYKWRSRILRAATDDLTKRLSRARLIDQGGQLSGKLLEVSRTKVLRLATGASEKVTRMIDRYDAVFATFVQEQQVEKFRQFLTVAPTLFMGCGQSIAILEHIMNFFDRRANLMRDGQMTSFNMARILADLEAELGLDFQVKLRIW